MNVTELADKLKLVRCVAGDGKVLNEAETMLRQQQAEIEALKANAKIVLEALLYEYGSTDNMTDSLANSTNELQEQVRK